MSNSPSEETRRKISAGLKRAYKKGLFPDPVKATNFARKFVDKEKLREHCKKISKNNIGRPMPPGPSAKGIDHHKAKYWIVHNVALGATLRGLNMSEIVADNPLYFDEYDLKNDKGSYSCRAANRLRSLFSVRKNGKPVARSWKGWTTGYL